MLYMPEANHFVTDGILRKGCIVRLKHFQANSVKGKKYDLVSQTKLAGSPKANDLQSFDHSRSRSS